MAWSLRRTQSEPYGPGSSTLGDRLENLEAGQLSTEGIRARVLQAFVDVSGAESGMLFDRPAGTGPYQAAGPAHAQTAVGSMRPSERFSNWLLANELCLRVPEDSGVTSYLPTEDHALLDAACARVVVPLIGGGRLSGILFLTSSQAGWRADDEACAAFVEGGRKAGDALERAHLRDVERETLQAQYRAEQLSMAGRLAAEVAHEVRNPLAAIRLTIQSFLETDVEPAVRTRLLERMLGEVDRIQDTVSRLLHLARPEELRLEDLDLAELTAASLDIVRSLAARHRIRIQADLNQPLRVRADRMEMQKVLLNLLMNACQAMPDGGTLRVTADIVVEHGNSRSALGRISVADTGSGVPADWQTRAFEPFSTTKKTGTGLGLPVSLDIVTRHNGRLNLSNGRPVGAVATVVLPLKDERDASE